MGDVKVKALMGILGAEMAVDSEWAGNELARRLAA